MVKSKRPHGSSRMKLRFQFPLCSSKEECSSEQRRIVDTDSLQIAEGFDAG